MKLAVCVQYDGSRFSGWQRQKHQTNTVQEHLETALAYVANQPISLVCAGRTDTGVHALYQICHFETDSVRSEREWILGTNSKLPKEVSIQWVKTVPNSFHARFGALSRTYRYLIHVAKFRSALWSQQVTWFHKELDVSAMSEAAEYLVGEQDFNAFKAAGCQSKHSVRTITKAQFQTKGAFICFEITANAFLQHMVRNVVGTLAVIGKREQEPEWLKFVLESKDRKQAGVTMPPNGLYFLDCQYPAEYCIPKSEGDRGLLSWFDH